MVRMRIDDHDPHVDRLENRLDERLALAKRVQRLHALQDHTRQPQVRINDVLHAKPFTWRKGHLTHRDQLAVTHT